ncbi:hypothetical protein NCCP2222_29320 [Sporosarcina sp. NCCP-2222]|uniref:hypothetical protein n=1 Tax=Sporosarcina sp. NCCP-2222 TaxID=2935073 RepID=UPI0020882C8D|nr:hypothetical protein [Sporosarcina sp. NCCP-2222]GKV56985.1 hypothetical protein NCCP2222_29320 [Sporosarcina sp. NCCP-2222]
MVESKMEKREKESKYFQPLKHISSRILEMERKSEYGLRVASKWSEIVKYTFRDGDYPVVHPIGRETFSLYAEFPLGVFEYAFDIDGAASHIVAEEIQYETKNPSTMIASVDANNINKDLDKMKKNHKNPVMIIESQYLTRSMPYCINGNHRIFEAYHNDEEQIDVYVFKELEFISFFYDALSKAIYLLEMDYHNVIQSVTWTDNEKHAAYTYF